MSEQLLYHVQKRSSIFTDRPLKTISKSAPSLPSLVSARSLDSKKKNKKILVPSIKTRQQLMHEQRFRGLLKQKVKLNDLHIQHCQYRQKRFQNKLDQNEYIRAIEYKLDKFIQPVERQVKVAQAQESVNPSIKYSQQKKEFTQNFAQLAKIANLVSKEVNRHLKNKIQLIFKSMTFRNIFQTIFQALLKQDYDLDSIYKMHHTLLKQIEHSFWKQLKIVGLKSGYLFQQYQKNRYRHLNEDISRIKKEMVEEGTSIGKKLKQIENTKLKNGIFRSLKDLDFQCLANRYFYEQLSSRVEKNLQFPMIF